MESYWGIKKDKFRSEYINSKKKFEKLKNANGDYLDLNFYVKNVEPLWAEPEWGFPKGRRNYKENDYDCAIREFKEESNFTDTEFEILNNVKPIEEKIIGTNGIYYKHIYYIGISKTQEYTNITNENEEIGKVDFFSYSEAIKIIRPYHVEKIKIISDLYSYILNNIICIINKNK